MYILFFFRHAADLCHHPDHSSAAAHPRGLWDLLLPDAKQEVITNNLLTLQTAQPRRYYSLKVLSEYSGTSGDQ